MKHDPSIRHMLERPMSNSGPMTPPQRRAMWAKKNDPQQASSSDRPYIPVPRVPIPGYPKNPPKPNGASESVAYGIKTDAPTPPETEFERVMRRIAEIRARPIDPNAVAQSTSRFDAGAKQAMPPPTQLPVDLYDSRGKPKPGTSGIWAGKDYDPTKPWKQPRGPWGRGVINNRAAAALHFLERHAGR